MRAKVKETIFTSKLQARTKEMQQVAYQKEASRNDQLKSKLLEEYNTKLNN